ncbi:MAG: sulfotransferase family protein [Myxococcota bacterium]
MLFHLPTLARILALTFSPRRFHWRHALGTVLVLGIFVSVEILVQIGRLLDHVLFPGFRRQEVREPVFIIANPRSGTTYLHRLFCMDGDRFTYLKTWHTIFPSITLYKLVHGWMALDRRLGRPVGRFIGWLEKKLFGGWERIHKVAFDQAEEDENLFLFTLLTPSAHLMFPWVRELDYINYLDRMPERVRRRVLRYYRSCIQRHLHATGPDKTFLDKSVFAAGRLDSLLETFPDARVVYIVRHPYEAIPSAVSMFHTVWRAHSPHLDKDSPPARQLADLLMDYYRIYLAAADRVPRERFATTRYEDLVDDPRSVVTSVYDQLGLEMSPDFAERLEEQGRRQRGYKSKHRYALEDFGITPDDVQGQLAEAFDVYGFAR